MTDRVKESLTVLEGNVKRQESVIEMRSSHENGWFTVRVDDNGLGISEEGTRKIFGAFFQDTASSEGIGVGLSIPKTIVEGLGGRVRLKSPGRGKGATAIVELPERAPE